MAAGRPTSAVPDIPAVIDISNVETGTGARQPGLRMATEAEIRVSHREQLGIDRAMRIVACRAALAQRGMLKDEGPGLLTMTLTAGLVRPGHRISARRFHDVQTMRVMALDAIHLALRDRVMLR